MDLSSLRFLIDQHRRPSGRLTIDLPLRAKILQAYATWREDEGSQKAFVETLGLRASSFASWLATAKSATKDAAAASQPLDGFRKVKLSTSLSEHAKISFVLPNGARLKGLSLDQALAVLEKFA